MKWFARLFHQHDFVYMRHGDDMPVGVRRGMATGIQHGYLAIDRCTKCGETRCERIDTYADWEFPDGKVGPMPKPPESRRGSRALEDSRFA